MVLEAPGSYGAPKGSEEAYGIKYLAVVKVTTDAGITGYADIETQPHVARAIVEAPSGDAVPGFQGLKHVLIGEDPFEVERLWQKMYMASVYYGRRGAAIQVISGIDIAPWGELMSIVAKLNGAVGCVCDSQIRDCIKIIELGFPVYYAGIRPLDSKGRGRVMAYDVPVRCGEVLVMPRNLIFADFDGIVVVPAEVEQDMLCLAREKVSKENMSRKELLARKTLREVYQKYGVL